MDTCNAHKCGEPGDTMCATENRSGPRTEDCATSRERPGGIHPIRYSRCHGLSVYPVCVCNTVRLGQVRSG